jgi:hypothetical protein
MLHPLALKVRREEAAGSGPEWAGVGLHLASLVAAGWMVVATLSRGAWVPGLVGGVIFVTALFMATGYMFPESRR